ncbi:MAG: hypothetical protein ACR2QG_04390 [Gammaproteobacteria bacterium]
MSGPLVFSVFTLVHAAIAVASLKVADVLLWPALCLFVVEAVTAFDNGVTVAGKSLGLSGLNRKLNLTRFFLHASCIGLLLPVYGGIGLELAFTGGVAEWTMLLCWILGLAICLFGYLVQFRGLRLIMPVNYFGCLRYAQSVNDNTRWPGYDYSEAELNNKSLPPLASIITTFIGLIIALMIGWFGSFWVPFIVTAVMLLAGAFPQRRWAPVATSGLEIIFSSGLFYSLWYAAQSVGQGA